MKIIRIVAGSCLWTAVLLGILWATGAIWYFEHLPFWLARPLAISYLLFCLWVFVFRRTGKLVFHPVTRFRCINRWTRSTMLGGIVLIYCATLSIQPRTDRDWANDQMRLPEVLIEGDRVTIRNFRDFRYRTADDPEPRYQDFSFRLDQLESTWFLVQRFTRFEGMAHTFVSFGLNTGQGKKYFSISVEIRREADEMYSPIAGMFRNYELMYVIGSEQDLIGVRTNVRENDRVFLYQTNATAAQTRSLFLEFAERVETLRHEPEFYGTLRNNCTNNIVAHTWHVTPTAISPLDPKVILPGYSAEVAFEYGLIGDGSQTYSELQAASRIDRRARKVGITESFSHDLRRAAGNLQSPNVKRE